MWKDEIVENVRAVRLELEKEANHDISTLYQQALEVQNEVKARLISKPLPEGVVTPSRA